VESAQVADAPAVSAPVAQQGARSWNATTLAVVGITILAVALRFWRLGHQSFWYDESVTLVILHRSFGGMLSGVKHLENTPPLYYCLGWVWARIFGFSEAGLRSLSAVAGVAVVPMMYGIGAKLISRRAGLIAAALTACNPLLVWYSQEARAYSLMVAFSALSLLAFVHLLEERIERRWLITWTVAAALALATHYYAALAVVPEAAWLAWRHRRDLRVWVALYVVGAVGAALLVFALSQKSSESAWITKTALSFRLGQIPPQFLLGTGTPDRTWLKIAGAVALLIAIALLLTRLDLKERRGAVFAAALALAGFVLSLLLVAGGTDRVITRNLLDVLIPIILLVAAGLGARRAGVLGLSGMAILCAVGVIATIAVSVDINYERAPWREVASVVKSNRPAGTAGAIIQEGSDSPLPLADYIPGLRNIDYGARVQELDVVAAVKVPFVPFCWWGAACFLPLAGLDTSLHIPGFYPNGPIVHVHEFWIYRLRAARPIFLTPQAVARALSNFPIQGGYGLFVQPPA
jgi:mannosyltransferase